MNSTPITSAPVMEWIITNRCNYNCLHCPYAANNTIAVNTLFHTSVKNTSAAHSLSEDALAVNTSAAHNSSEDALAANEWTIEEAEKFLDEAKNCQIPAINITGGEPLLHKYFFEIAEDICRRNITMQELNTNGQFISQNVLDWLKEINCNPMINISFDGVGCHDWLRNHNGSQQETLQTIHLCLENGFQVRAVTNVHRQNVRSILPTAELLDEMGVTEMSILCTEKMPRETEHSEDICLDAGRYCDYMLEFLERYVESGHFMPIHIHRMLSLFPKQKEYSIAFCREKLVLAANGNVYLCLPVSDCCKTEYQFLGNAKTEGLQTVLARWKDLPDKEIPLENRLFFKGKYYDKIKKRMADWGYSPKP